MHYALSINQMEYKKCVNIENNWQNVLCFVEFALILRFE